MGAAAARRAALRVQLKPGFPRTRRRSGSDLPLCVRASWGGKVQYYCTQVLQAANARTNPIHNKLRGPQSRASDASSAKLLNAAMGGGLPDLLESVRRGVEQGVRLVSSRPSGAGVYVGNGKVGSVLSHSHPEWANRVFLCLGSVLKWSDVPGSGRISVEDAVNTLGAYFLQFGQTTSGLACAMVSSHPAGSRPSHQLLSCAPCVRADREGCAGAHEGARVEGLHHRAAATALDELWRRLSARG